jgi:hypothetical protein
MSTCCRPGAHGPPRASSATMQMADRKSGPDSPEAHARLNQPTSRRRPCTAHIIGRVCPVEMGLATCNILNATNTPRRAPNLAQVRGRGPADRVDKKQLLTGAAEVCVAKPASHVSHRPLARDRASLKLRFRTAAYPDQPFAVTTTSFTIHSGPAPPSIPARRHHPLRPSGKPAHPFTLAHSGSACSMPPAESKAGTARPAWQAYAWSDMALACGRTSSLTPIGTGSVLLVFGAMHATGTVHAMAAF